MFTIGQFSCITRLSIRTIRCVQMMHSGRYDKVGQSFRRLDEYARKQGLGASYPAHEIYISDPRRVQPAKLKTIVRRPVSNRAE